LVDTSPDLRSALGFSETQHLPISTLRGQFVDNRLWLEDPASPAIVLGTVDMVGSRLLFEGYGVSHKMRPYHAGLLGADTLLVIDEAHLVPAFERLVESIAEGTQLFGPRDDALRALVPPLRLMSLSATGRAVQGAFGLTPGDLDHPTVRRRLDARKRLVVREPLDTEEESLPEALAREAWNLCESGAQALRCIIFCNSRDDAQKVRDRLEKLGAGDKKSNVAPTELDLQLFVGGRRVHERERAASWLSERGFLAGHPARPRKPTFVVATSAGEVGVDLDADHMVCDLVAWERMVQRLGRVNRRGDGAASVVVLPATDDKKTRVALETEVAERSQDERRLAARAAILDATQKVLRELPAEGQEHDASPGALRSLKLRTQQDLELFALLECATTPEPLRPALTRALVEAWSMTSLEEHAGRPEVQPWLRGWVDDEPQTTIVWRKHLPVWTDGRALKDKNVADFFDAAGPHTLEQLETETYRASDWLTKRLEAVLKTQPAFSPHASSRAPPEEDTEAVGEIPTEPLELSPVKPQQIVAFVISANGETIYPVEAAYFRDQRSSQKRAKDMFERLNGGTLVVDVRLGGLKAGLLDDRSPTASDIADERDDRTVRVGSVGSAENADPEWREELRIAVHTDGDGGADRWLLIESRLDTDAATEEGRSVSHAQLLDEHQAWAERRARSIGTRLKLPPAYADMVALAAKLHDEGKRAKLWQRAFHAPKDGDYGKTTSRPNIALLDGYRHELGSLLRTASDPRLLSLEDGLRDLCLHIIVTHHGFARPTIGTRSCEDAPPSMLAKTAQSIALRFSRLEKRWGPWGLAWWETLLRAADQQASRENDERKGEHGDG
ncbi:MAG: hypothetical protein RLZZ450_4658, partial [Pseudomonadota bacterium]